MANIHKRLADNVDGDFFVDSTCVNCGVSRHYAPSIFGDSGSHAFVKKQPDSEGEELSAKQALLACPVAAIGTLSETDLRAAKRSFPLAMAPDVFLTGFNSPKSYGAHSYFVAGSPGNWLIDSPRFSRYLVDRFTEMGGVDHIFLTHSDDVADADKYAEHFNARRVIHELELHAQPGAETVLEGNTEWQISDAHIVFAPGHTKGHLVMLWKNRYLFSGDHLAWLPGRGRLGSFRDYCWHSWPEQIQSVAKLSVYEDVEWLFPGHGKWQQIPKGEFPSMVNAAVEWMREL